MNIVALLHIFFLFVTPNLNAELKCPKGSYYVRAHARKAYYRGDGTLVRATSVKASCREKAPGYDLWMPRLKSGPPPNWPFKMEAPSKWTDEEQERVLEALGELPEFLWGNWNTKIFRLSRSKDFPNPASQGDEMIVLYDTAFKRERRLARILAHELAHQQYDHLSGDDALDYRRATGWKLAAAGLNFIWKGRDKGYVESDGDRSPGEDFANNLDYFIFAPRTLAQVTPAAYQWFKGHYGDKVKSGEK
jgi:hypothetical protein